MSKEHIYHSNYKTHLTFETGKQASMVFAQLKSAGKTPKWYTTPVAVEEAI